jgi:hypothetical protein
VQSKGEGEGFFHIDRRIWKLVCDRSDINVAAAYLGIATGTGSGNRVSFWSAQAIEKFTGLHNVRATAAIRELIAAGFVRLRDDSSRTRPIYELQSYLDIVGGLQRTVCSDGPEAKVLAALRRGRNLSPKEEVIARRLAVAGIIFCEGGDKFSSDPPPAEPAAQLIWLPNTLFTGTAQRESSPVKRLRSLGDLNALRLLIDLYQAQNLSADGGISRAALRHEYERKKCGERGKHIIWRFKSKQSLALCHSSTKTFWDPKMANNLIFSTLETLKSMALLEIVPHLVENANNDCEPIHGFGWDGAGEDLEMELGRAADQAAQHMLGEARLYTAVTEDGIEMMAPVWNTQANVQMVGVYRLTYRPHTQMTADWCRRMNERAVEWLGIYQQLNPPAIARPPIALEGW